MKDYYTLLGVSRTATPNELKHAYRRLAVKYHPDKNPDPAAVDYFKEVTEAYNVLIDWEQRKQYDLHWENPFSHPEKKGHQEGAVRRRTPAGYKSRNGQSSGDLIHRYMPYFRMISVAGLLFSILLTVDLLLPYEENLERIEKEASSKKSNKERGYLFVTTAGNKIKVYNDGARLLLKEEEIRFSRTAIFKTVMNISDRGPTLLIEMGYIYNTLSFFPLILLVASAIGTLYKRNVRFPFNLSIVSGVFLLLTVGAMLLL